MCNFQEKLQHCQRLTKVINLQHSDRENVYYAYGDCVHINLLDSNKCNSLLIASASFDSLLDDCKSQYEEHAVCA